MLDVSDATPPSAERLVTHRLLESVLPQPILVMSCCIVDDVSTVDSDDIDDDTVVEHIDDGGGQEESNFELSNSNSCLCPSLAATGHILLERWLGKDSGGGGRLLLLPHSASIVICCSWNDRRELLLMFIVTVGCIRYVVKFYGSSNGACRGVLPACFACKIWERLNSHFQS